MIDPKSELAARKGVRTFRQLQELWDIPASYLCDVMKGRKPASEKLLELLGLRKTIVYERISTERPIGLSRKRAARTGNSG